MLFLHSGDIPYFKLFHCTVSALLCEDSGILLAEDSENCTILVPLYLSAAFDTADHIMLLDHLSIIFLLVSVGLHWSGLPPILKTGHYSPSLAAGTLSASLLCSRPRFVFIIHAASSSASSVSTSLLANVLQSLPANVRSHASGKVKLLSAQNECLMNRRYWEKL